MQNHSSSWKIQEMITKQEEKWNNAMNSTRWWKQTCFRCTLTLYRGKLANLLFGFIPTSSLVLLLNDKIRMSMLLHSTLWPFLSFKIQNGPDRQDSSSLWPKPNFNETSLSCWCYIVFYSLPNVFTASKFLLAIFSQKHLVLSVSVYWQCNCLITGQGLGDFL